MVLSNRQIQSIQQANLRLNVWVGAVRSGKTFSSILKFIDFLRSGPLGDVMIIGVNRESIQRNILGILYKILGFPEPSSKTNEVKLYGRRLYFVGAHDESSVRRIQGATLAAAYVDEATCIPQPFWRMLLSRLSIPKAQLFATCNPEGPAHWLKKEYIDRTDLDLVFWNFCLDDNPSLSNDYKENLKKEYSGMWYKRYILGEWALAHGAIYDCFDHDNMYDNPTSNPSYYICGIDYGTTNATAAVIIAINPKFWPQMRVEKEYYWDSAKEGRGKSDEELSDDIIEFCEYRSMAAIYIDPAAASLKLALRNRNLSVVDGNNDVLLGIKHCAKFISGKNLVIHKSCKILTEQIQSYGWDTKAADAGFDKPVKKNDHLVDALRYAICTAFPTGDFSSADQNLTIDQIRKQVYGDSPFHDFGQHTAGGYM